MSMRASDVVQPTPDGAPSEEPDRGNGEPPRSGRMGPVRRGIREVGLGMITLGVIILLFVGYQLFGTGIAEAHSQSSLKKQFNTAVAAQRSAHPSTDNPTLRGPAGNQSPLPTVPAGGAIAHMTIPRIGLDKFVVQGVSEADLRRGPGHYPGTVLPGENGNTAIAGHRTTYGAPFFRLNEMVIGDPIYITDLAGRTFVYKVSQPPETVSPDDVSVLNPTPFAELTLTTCTPRFTATSRLVVVARLVGRALPVVHVTAKATTAKAAAAPAASIDNLGNGDSNAWGPAIGYGALVVLTWIGVRIWINRTRRWARVAAYVIGIGLCLIPLWLCFENVILLLPQSI